MGVKRNRYGFTAQEWRSYKRVLAQFEGPPWYTQLAYFIGTAACVSVLLVIGLIAVFIVLPIADLRDWWVLDRPRRARERAAERQVVTLSRDQYTEDK